MAAKSLSGTIYDELKRRILSHEYKANELVSEKTIAAQFGVSKTPAREALNQLCQEGFITRYPSFGYIIKELSYHDAQDICELRFILECAAVRIIVKYAGDAEIKGLYGLLRTDEVSESLGYGKNTTFHTELGRLTGNSYLMDDIMRLAMSSERPATYLEARGNGMTDYNCHEKIVDALAKRDVEEAEKYLRLDILSGEHRDF